MHLYRYHGEVLNTDAFVAKISLNLAIDASRRRLRNPVQCMDLDHIALPDPQPGPYEILDGKQRLEMLKSGLAAMTKKNRTILLAHRVDGLTYAAIARREGITVSAVERQISRAVKFLTVWMGGRPGTVRQ